MRAALLAPNPQTVEVEVDHRCREQRHRLANDQPADDGDSQRAAPVLGDALQGVNELAAGHGTWERLALFFVDLDGLVDDLA